MKLLWVCSVDIAAISKNEWGSVSGGWIYGAYKGLKDQINPAISFCFPGKEKKHRRIDENIEIYYYLKNDDNVEYFSQIIDEISPDIIHIFGTESKFTNDMLIASENRDILNHTIVNVQGLISLIAEHYTVGLPLPVIYGWTFRDIIKRDNIYFQMKSFQKRGTSEIYSIKKAHHVLGRTQFDRAGTNQINPLAKYYNCNEILRPSFYEKRWRFDACKRHTIFVSQCSYPIKGLHILLNAMPIILKEYPDAKIVTTGSSVMDSSIRYKMHRDSYSKYLNFLIRKLNLSNCISFLGRLNEEQMAQAYLESNVFVCCSTIENSPNSLGEAMILGMPIVSSYVGGVMDMLCDKYEGYLYQSDASYMLAHYICKIFNDEKEAIRMGENARKHALTTHDISLNTERLISIYQEIMSL